MFSIRLKEVREARGFSQQAFANKFGVSQSTVGMWESGKREPNFETVQKIASFFNISVDYLLGINPKSTILNERLKDLLENYGDYKPFADKLNVNISTVFSWIKGASYSCYDKINEIADFFGVSIDYLLGRVDDNLELLSDTPSSYIKIPVLGKIPAGIPLEAIEDIMDYIDIPEDMMVGGKSFFALKIKGDSMIPKYEDGDVVLFEKANTCDSGTDCAVMVNGDDATFKRVEIKENGIMLKPMNPNYDTMFYTSEEVENKPVRIIGIARQVRRNV